MGQCKVSYNDVADLRDDDARHPFQDSPFYDRLEGYVVDFEKMMANAYRGGRQGSQGMSEVTKRNTVVLNEVVRDARDNPLFPTLYPNLNDRVNRNPFITPTEVEEFIKRHFHTRGPFYENMGGGQSEPNRTAIDYRNRVLVDMNQFYGQSQFGGSLSNFCSIVPNIFAKIKAFSNFFNNVQSIAGKIGDLLSGGFTGLLNTIKSKAETLVQAAMEQGKQMLRNFSFGSFESSHPFNMGPTLGRALEERDRADSFFSQSNIDSLKERVNGLIAYATQTFESPTIEEVEFLVYRFCQLLQNLESGILGVLNPLRTLVNQHENARTALQASSGLNTARAVAAGAIRVDEANRAQSSSTAVGVAQEAGGGEAAHPSPVTTADIEGVPRWEDIRDGRDTDGRIVLGPNLSGDSYAPSGSGRNMGREGWEGVVPDARVRLMRVQKDFGKKLTVNSGYRSPDYNAATDGAATGSRHMRGEALDISWSGFSNSRQERDRFVAIARSHGFKGIGGYNSFIHIDIGPERTWGIQY